MKRQKNHWQFSYWLFVAVRCLFEGLGSRRRDGKDPDWERGRAVYIANCVACHNSDPSRDGPIGPAIKGSAKELLEARVLVPVTTPRATNRSARPRSCRNFRF